MGWEGVCFCSFPHKQLINDEYHIGRAVQWGCFVSATTSIARVEGLSEQRKDIVFKVMISQGKVIEPYSYFPVKDEVLLMPYHKFVVASPPYMKGGFTFIDLVQMKDKLWQ